MKLYHGTYLENLIEIIKSGKLDNKKVSETTQLFDELFEIMIGENFTKYAIYMSDDLECTRFAYDYEFELNTNNLDTNCLFVADFTKREEAFASEDSEQSKILSREYKDSFIPYNEYKCIKNEYDKNHTLREYLYFKDIDVSDYIKSNKEDILEIFENEWLYQEDYKTLLGDFYTK